MILFCFLFMLVIVFGFLETWVGVLYDTAVYRTLYTVTYVIQRVPIVVLVVMIVAQRDTPDGPTKKSKAWLVVGALLSLANDLPIEIWGTILPGGCPFVIASWIDVVFLTYIISLLCFFLFLRAEYKRNMEETIWNCVSQIQDTFDFRSF